MFYSGRSKEDLYLSKISCGIVILGVSHVYSNGRVSNKSS